MYGKFHSTCFTGSMYGSSLATFAVWGYAIACADAKGFVELNPRSLAGTFNCEPKEVESAIAYLCAPDPQSRTPADEGRRLVREGQFLYRIVNYATYRAIRTTDDRLAYQREWDRENRPSGHARGKKARARQSDGSPTAVRQSDGSPTQEEAKAEEVKNHARCRVVDASFEQFWTAYPKRKSRGVAERAFQRLNPSAALLAVMVKAIERAKASEQWAKDGGQFIPYPATWLTARGWEDEVTLASTATVSDWERRAI